MNNKWLVVIGAAQIAAFLAAAEPKPKVALCASDRRAGDIVEVISAPLSRDDNVVLLDRADIAKVLAEQHMALDGLLSTDDALKVGQLLHCDIFAEMHAEGAGSDAVVLLIMFDAVTGVRLCDQVFPANGTTDQLSATLLRALTSGLDKWKARTSGSTVRTLSLVGVRGMDLPASATNIPNVISALLEREILRSSGVTVLERKHLDRINQERELTDIARDHLLASTVRLDIDVLRYKSDTNLEVRAILSDVSGKAIATVQEIGSVENPVAIVKVLGDGILAALQVASVTTDKYSCHDEAFRFFSDMKVLALRGENQHAAIAEEAALALAETALTENPDDNNIQHLVVYFLRRKEVSVTDPWQRIDLLERDIGICEKWPVEKGTFAEGYFADTYVCIKDFASLLERALRELKALPGDRNTADPRLVRLRERFGGWVKEMRKTHWRYLIFFRYIELYSHTADEALDEADRLLTFVPPELILDEWFGQWIPRKSLLFPIDTYTGAQKRRLEKLYNKWGLMGDDRDRFCGCLSAAILVNTFPGDFENPTTRIDEALSMAADIAAADFCNISGRLLNFLQTQACVKWRPSWRAFPTDSVLQAELTMMQKMDKDGVIVPELYVSLDEIGEKVEVRPGEFLETAWNMLQTGRRHLLHSPASMSPPVEPVLAQLANVYMERYGKTFSHSNNTSRNVVGGMATFAGIVRLSDADKIQGTICAAAWSDTNVYLLVDNAEATYEMWQVALQTGKSARIGSLKTPCRFVGKTGVSCEGAFPGMDKPLLFSLPVDAQISVGQTTVTVPCSSGLIVFYKTGELPKVITVENGLPAKTVLSCCEAGGCLYIGCKGDKEGYLVKCNPDGSGAKVLACSGSNDKHSELDDCIPYVVESIINDSVRNRLFIVASMPTIKWSGWLYSLNLTNDQIQAVCRNGEFGGFLRELRAAGNERYVVRIHSCNTAVNNVPGYLGYGIWNSSNFRDIPMHCRELAIQRLMGNGFDFCQWTDGGTNFNIYGCVTPSSTAALALLDERHLVASDGTKWQLIARSDAGASMQNLPLLVNTAPFAIDVADEKLFACSTAGLWRVEIKLTESTVAAADAGAAGKTVVPAMPTPPPALTQTGVLQIEAPVGSWIDVDDQRYRVGIKKPFIWNQIPTGEHKVRITFCGKEKCATVQIQAGKLVTITEAFGEDTAKMLVLDMGNHVKTDLMWIPQESHAGRGFWMGKHEVTQEQYNSLVATNLNSFPSLLYPMPNEKSAMKCSKAQAEQFCQKLIQTRHDALQGMIARLPTVAEWNFACKAERTNTVSSGDGCGLNEMPNIFWLYDTLNAEMEWVCDGPVCGNGSGGYSPDRVPFRIVIDNAEVKKRQ